MEAPVGTLPRLLHAKEVADATGLPLARVYELSRNGEMPVIRLGRAMRFNPQEVAAWFASGGTKNGNGRAG
jgi:excisionase family DNA binding protein